jgi:hypothetical protein
MIGPFLALFLPRVRGVVVQNGPFGNPATSNICPCLRSRIPVSMALITDKPRNVLPLTASKLEIPTLLLLLSSE